MTKEENNNLQKAIGISERQAGREASNSVIARYFDDLEKGLKRSDFLRLKIQRCEEGVTSIGTPAWEVDVVSYHLKELSLGEVIGNIELDKLYPMRVWREDQNGKKAVRVAMRKGQRIRKLT